VAALLSALAVYMVIIGLQIHHDWAVAMATCHTGVIGCSGQNSVLDPFEHKWHGQTSIALLLHLIPALIGAFAGAPVLARELETSTFRYAWTQGIGRVRWTLAKLVLLGAGVAAAAAAFGELAYWFFGPFITSGDFIPLDYRLFDLHGVAFAAWTLAAFAIGALAGVLIRRVVPAIAATLAVYTGLALAAALCLRQHYLPPLVSGNPSIGAPNWVLSSWYTGPGGKVVSQATVNRACPGGGPYGSSPGAPPSCIPQHGFTQWTSYQPVGRFWPFQFIEGGWLLALSVLCIAAAVWLVRRRAA
jgi:hypothetical protein